MSDRVAQRIGGRRVSSSGWEGSAVVSAGAIEVACARRAVVAAAQVNSAAAAQVQPPSSQQVMPRGSEWSGAAVSVPWHSGAMSAALAG